ncbi:response regulator [Pedobacter puniceum]|uniref:Response regulator n=1 Tax=Pedobacter puniceum TaxID=2666136 RepID=A0A7K0FRQ2_9SPHI|nr:response regulator [Pedobacter puniceum]MRX48676.1 response regulator [Pedobacter puniceum]
MTYQKKILIVDDNDINKLLIKKMLSKFELDMDFASNGQEAYDMILTKAYDIVLMDVHMPILSGLEATKQIRTLEDIYFKELPIIALTSCIMPTDIDEVYEYGMNDYQSKPFKIEELLEKIERLRLAK